MSTTAKIDSYIAMMAPHQKERTTGSLLIEAREAMRAKDETIDSLRAQFAQANAQVVMLREAFSCPAITASNADSMAYHFSKGEPFAGLTKEAMIAWLKYVSSEMNALDKAMKQTPADALREVLGPTMELLKEGLRIYREQDFHMAAGRIEKELDRLRKWVP